MKTFLISLLAALSICANAATTLPVQMINPAGSTAGQAAVSTGPSTPPTWGNVTAAALAPQGANTVLGNATASSAAPAALSVPSCSAVGSVLNWTAASGFGCVTTGAFTTLSASSASKVFATNTSGQSIPTATLTTVTGWTTTFDANSNFTASTGTFTAPRAGYYQVSAAIQFVGTTWAAADSEIISVAKNGTTVAQTQVFTPGGYAGNLSSVPISILVSCNASDTIVIKVFQNSGASLALAGTGTLNFLSIEQIP